MKHGFIKATHFYRSYLSGSFALYSYKFSTVRTSYKIYINYTMEMEIYYRNNTGVQQVKDSHSRLDSFVTQSPSNWIDCFVKIQIFILRICECWFSWWINWIKIKLRENNNFDLFYTRSVLYDFSHFFPWAVEDNRITS